MAYPEHRRWVVYDATPELRRQSLPGGLSFCRLFFLFFLRPETLGLQLLQQLCE
jgi:hypothetical protein